MVEKSKILIVDDHPVVVEGIKKALKDESDLEIVGTAGDGAEALRMVKSLEPDIVIMDISMPNLDGLEATHEIRSWNDQISVIIFTMYSAKEYIVSLFRMGVSAYLFKGEPMEDLVMAIRVIREGGTYYSKSVQEIIRDRMDELSVGSGTHVREVKNGIAKLSIREKEVFLLLADGLRPKEIADRLCISPKTVETHKYNIMTKLNLSSVAQFTKLALKKDLIDL